jgi:hypothetical protein
MDVFVFERVPIILLLPLEELLIMGRLPPLSRSESLSFYDLKTKPSSWRCFMKLNLSCLPSDLISVNRTSGKDFSGLKL